MTRTLMLLSLFALVACGADGAPSARTPDPAPASGVTITGDARLGVVVNPALVEDGTTP